MDLINGFGRASSSFGSNPPIGSGQARGSLHLKTSYWWSEMKKDVSDFVTKCMVCQKVKVEYQVLCSLLEYPSGNETESQWILWSDYH